MVADSVATAFSAPGKRALAIDDDVLPREASELIERGQSAPHRRHDADGSVLMTYRTIVDPDVEIPVYVPPEGHPPEGLPGAACWSMRFQERHMCSLKSEPPPSNVLALLTE